MSSRRRYHVNNEWCGSFQCFAKHSGDRSLAHRSELGSMLAGLLQRYMDAAGTGIKSFSVEALLHPTSSVSANIAKKTTHGAVDCISPQNLSMSSHPSETSWARGGCASTIFRRGRWTRQSHIPSVPCITSTTCRFALSTLPNVFRNSTQMFP